MKEKKQLYDDVQKASDRLKDSDYEGLVTDNKGRIVKHSEKLFESLTGDKAPAGLGLVVYAHIKAPMQAYKGDGKGAVDTSCAAIGALAGGVIGGPIGSAVGALISKAPGAIISFYDTSSIKHTISIQNCTPLTIVVDAVPDNLGFGLGNVSIENGQSVYFNDQVHDPQFDSSHGKDPRKAAGEIILPAAHCMESDDGESVETFTPIVTLGQKKTSFLYSMRLRGVDSSGTTIKSWTYYLQRPPPDAGSQTWGMITSLGGLTGGGNTCHYCNIWQRDGNGAPAHDYAKENASHQKHTGPENGEKSYNSFIYWKDWDTAVVCLQM